MGQRGREAVNTAIHIHGRRVKCSLLCLGDEELRMLSPSDCPLGFHCERILCPLIFIMGQTPLEYSIPNWWDWKLSKKCVGVCVCFVV